MIRSMTGYGKAESEINGKKISVEIRSLNSKQLDLSVKLPAAFRPVEYELRAAAAEKIGRGKADIYVNAEEGSSTGGAKINAGVFAEYYRQIKEAAKNSGIALGGDGFDNAAIISSILRMPDVLAGATPDAPEEEDRTLLNTLKDALTAFDGFRAQEGAILMRDILARVDTIRELLVQVEPFEKARVPTVRARILENIAAAGVTVDANRLEQEIVFWVEKLDITEEKVRLAKHCDYFLEVTGDEQGVGRKLGFVAQEIGREINTLGSKANDAEIQKIVIRMKDELEKIKEQLLNIL